LRFLTRCYLAHVDRVNKLHPRYRLCPVECEEGYNAKRKTPCDNCQIKSLDDQFKESVLGTWAMVGVPLWKYKFEEVLRDLYKAIRFKEMPKDKMTVHTHGIVNVYQSEYNFLRDKKDFEDREKRQPKS
jgi:hypothetical protein